MPNITYCLKLTVDEQTFEYISTEQITEKEMLGSERPQLFFDGLCKQVERRANEKVLNQRLREISIDQKVSESYLSSDRSK